MNDNPFGPPAGAGLPNTSPAQGQGQTQARGAFDFDSALSGAESANQRDPKPSNGCTYRFRIDEVRAEKLAQVGPAVQIFTTVVLTNDTRIKPGEKTYQHISGFNSQWGREFAQADLKAFLLVALAHHGIKPEHLATDAQIKDVSRKMVEQKLAEGAVVDCYVTEVTGKYSGKSKQKYEWRVPAPASK